jgi:hypothetical protein
MLTRLLVQLREWAGVLALILVLTGGVAYGANTVFSSDITNNQVFSADVRNDTLPNGGLAAVDIATAAVTSTEIANNQIRSQDVRDDTLSGGGLTGDDIAESTLHNVNAGAVGGLQVRKINFQVPYGTGPTTVLDLAGLQITAECQDFGDGLDVKAFTSKNGASVHYFAAYSGNADDTDASRDIDSASVANGAFDIGDQLQIDNATPNLGINSIGTLNYSAPDGSVVVARLALDEFGACALTGIAIGG